MHFILRYLIIFFSSLFLTNAFAAETPIYKNTTQIITVSSANPVFQLTQPTNPTTGYSWTVKSYDKNLLELQIQQFQKPEKLMPGAGGKMLWQFRALPQAFQQNEATTQIVLVYARPWVPQDDPKQVVVTVRFEK